MSRNPASVLFDISGSALGVPGNPVHVTGSITTQVVAVQTVTGSVGIGGPVPVVNGPSPFEITTTGSLPVTVDNFPGTQKTWDSGTRAVSGSVNIYTHGAQLVSGTIATYTQGTQGISGSVSVAGSVSVHTQGPQNISGTVSVGNWPVIHGISGSVSTYTQGPQAVSGSVNVYTQGAQAVSGTVFVTTTGSFPVTVPGIVQITGSVGIGGPIALDRGMSSGNPLYISGSISTTNVIGTQAVTGSVSVYTHGAQLVSGSVSTYTQGTQDVSGTVSIGNWPPVIGISGSTTLKVWDPGVQAISGSVYTHGPQDVSGSVSVYTQGAQLVSGTVNVGNWPLNIAVSGSQLTGSTFSGMPVVIGGVQSGSLQVRGVMTDANGVLFITGSVGLTDAAGREVIVGPAASGSTAIGNPVQIAGIDTSGLLGTGSIVRSIIVDQLGRIITAPAGSNTTNGFVYGQVTTVAVVTVPVRKTTYTEPASNAQRSISSANAADTAAGTGARQVLITYYDVNYTGPYTEIVTLNGTTAVSTVNTNICFIEKMQVVTVGSGGANAGIITLYVNAAGGGGAIGTMAVGDNNTWWAHHYVPVGKVCYITGMTGNNNSNVNACVFSIRARASGANKPELQVSDTVRQGSTLSQTVRTFGTPLKVWGPSRITMFVTAEGSATVINRCSFDFYEA